MTPGTASAINVRADFPVLDRGIAYLDSAATSQKPRPVIDAISSYYENSNANVHRGVYALAQEATDLFEGARERIAAFVGGETATTIFTRNATEALNLVAYAWGREHVGEGDEVLITHMEHHSNIVPWQLLCQERGAKLRYLEVSDDGQLSLDELDSVLAIRPREAGVGRARVQRARHDQPGGRDRRPRTRGRRGVGDRRVPGGATDAGRRRRDRRGLLRLDRPQGARARPASACCTGAASCSSRCAPSSAAAT